MVNGTRVGCWSRSQLWRSKLAQRVLGGLQEVNEVRKTVFLRMDESLVGKEGEPFFKVKVRPLSPLV